jgi:hypothetical protein
MFDRFPLPWTLHDNRIAAANGALVIRLEGEPDVVAFVVAAVNAYPANVDVISDLLNSLMPGDLYLRATGALQGAAQVGLELPQPLTDWDEAKP